MIPNKYAKSAVAIVALALVASAVAATGATVSSHVDGQEPASQDTSYLRVVHTSPDAPAVNVTVDNETLVSNVSFGEATEYMNLTAGTYNVTISATDNPAAVVFDGNLTVEPREVLTVTATGEVSNGAQTSFQPVVFSDNAWTPGEGQAAVSLVHASPDIGNVDVVVLEGPGGEDTNATATPTATATAAGTATATGTPADTGPPVLAENVSFRNVTDYVNVPAGNYTLGIRSAGDDGMNMLTTVEVSLEEGETYTAVAAGYLIPSDEPGDQQFTVILLEDASMSPHFPSAGTETPEETGTEMPEEAGTETPEETGTETPEETEGEGTETPEEEETETETATES